MQDALKAIYTLGGARQRVTTAQVASQLNKQCSTMTGMFQRLAHSGWIDYQTGHGAILTERGLAEGRRVLRRHGLVELLLTRVLRLDWSEVHSEAEALEHAVSPRVEQALARFLGEPEVGPFGQAIPSETDAAPRALQELSTLAEGHSLILREFDEDPERLRRWSALGLTPGARVQVVRIHRLDGVVEIRTADRTWQVGLRVLKGLRGEPAPEGPPAGLIP